MTLIIFIAVGFVAGFVLIFLSKFMMAGLLQRKPNYYEDQYDQIDPASPPHQGGGAHG